MASFASSATTGGARKHAWTNLIFSHSDQWGLGMRRTWSWGILLLLNEWSDLCHKVFLSFTCAHYNAMSFYDFY